MDCTFQVEMARCDGEPLLVISHFQNWGETRPVGVKLTFHSNEDMLEEPLDVMPYGSRTRPIMGLKALEDWLQMFFTRTTTRNALANGLTSIVVAQVLNLILSNN